MIVYLARHGETTWNLAGRYQGRRESMLSALGVQQGMALANAMCNADPAPQRIVSSPLLRCLATARFTAERLDLPVEIDPDLIEIGHGDWEGRLRGDIMASDPERWQLWKSRPTHAVFSDGDSIVKVGERWRAFAARPVDEPALVVSHDATARAAILLTQGRSLDALWDVAFENAAYAVFDAEPGGWRVVEPLVTAHLDGLRADVATQAL